MVKKLRVDFHTHIISEDFPNLAEKYGDDRFPILQNNCSCGAEILVQGKTFRKITNPTWDPIKRMEDMDKEGVDIQVLSPIPVTFSYWSDSQSGLELAKSQNNFIASVVEKNPDRFIGMGTVPLQDVKLAIAEMERAVKILGLKGIQIGSNVNGLNLDDSSLYHFFEAAAEINVPLFVHPWAMLGRERLQKFNSMYTIGMPSETALAAGSIIMSGLMDKLPNLKVCFAHGGGSLPYVLPRMDKGWEVWPETRQTEKPPSFYAKKLYYDSLVYDPVNLKFMIEQFGAKQIIAGSDYPFLLRETPVGRVIDNLEGVAEDDVRLMLGQNALGFLGLHELTKA
ncbi:amidohydrolase family protein [Oceanobacillus polygoni]|uniref:2-amino-3-carboxymuconate-6-semialdehyde decarboxylase n=1 Tax=Oceanobacillus polygoni TaxID=1235259 RepID=A0A9X0YSB8_9BACI|nr:amidohydrolase family protein [Oceanobacillus polygoni]MBP2076096.1 aminocarboxymuconate-semialdehyde decarboxylase [Oceanobacillus polygoni]